MPAIIQAVVNTPDPETEACRSRVRTSSLVMMLGSLLVLLGFWVGFVWEVSLFALALTTSIVIIVHTKSFESAHNKDCCCSRNNVFSILKILCITQIGLAGILLAIEAYFLVVSIAFGQGDGQAILIGFVVISIIGTLVLLITSSVCITTLRTLHQRVTDKLIKDQGTLAPIDPVAAATTVVVVASVQPLERTPYGEEPDEQQQQQPAQSGVAVL